MPRCPSCREHVCPDSLLEVGGSLACCECRKLKLVPETEAKMIGNKEDRSKEGAERTKLLEVQLYAIDGGRDHQVEASVKMGGALFVYNTTFDKVRKFFTERREKKAAAKTA
jgi:hypothetical protein